MPFTAVNPVPASFVTTLNNSAPGSALLAQLTLGSFANGSPPAAVAGFTDLYFAVAAGTRLPPANLSGLALTDVAARPGGFAIFQTFKYSTGRCGQWSGHVASNEQRTEGLEGQHSPSISTLVGPTHTLAALCMCAQALCSPSVGTCCWIRLACGAFK